MLCTETQTGNYLYVICETVGNFVNCFTVELFDLNNYLIDRVDKNVYETAKFTVPC